MTTYRRGKHSVTLLYSHLVFVVKYRKKIFLEEHINYLKTVFPEVGRKMDFKVLEVDGGADHCHLLIEYPPKLSISQIVNSLKGVSSRLLRKRYKLTPHKDHLWSPSYFAVSCGGAPLEKIKEYIQNQRKPS
jgi:putative transposase